jgi:CRP-like cAMP-binding protein/FixJ family two-component response regulator
MNTLLLVEDDLDLLNSTSRMLTLSNYNVITAENGSAALERIKENSKKLDLILCDIKLRELDGYGVFHAYKNIPEMRGVPFVFMTPNADRADIRKCMDMGADDCLVKPYSGNEILSLITSRLDKSHNAQEKKENNFNELGNLLFDKTDFSNFKMFKDRFHVKKIKKKETLFSAGEISLYTYYIISGKVKRFKGTDLGKEYITNIYGGGDFFSNYSIQEISYHEDSAMTLEDSEIGMIPKDEFLKVLSNNNEMCFKYINHISKLLKKAEENLPKLAYYSARKRIAEALLLVADSCGDGKTENFCFSVSRADLSAISGIAEESVSRNLTDFRKEGLIDNLNGRITIKDLKKLRMIKN